MLQNLTAITEMSENWSKDSIVYCNLQTNVSGHEVINNIVLANYLMLRFSHTVQRCTKFFVFTRWQHCSGRKFQSSDRFWLWLRQRQLFTWVMYSCGAKLKSGRFDVRAIPAFSDFHTYTDSSSHTLCQKISNGSTDTMIHATAEFSWYTIS